MSLFAYTAHLFALAIRETFPDAVLLGGRIDEVGFFYSFSHPRPIPREMMSLIEEKMRGWIKEPPVMRLQEMVPANAALLFRDKGEEALSQLCLESNDELVKVILLGSYWDLAIDDPEPLDKFAFALIDVKEKNGVWEVFGTAFPDKAEVKALVKRVRGAEKRIGIAEKYLVMSSKGPLWLPQGVAIRRRFYELFLESLPKGACEVMTPDGSLESHQALYQGSPVWEWRAGGDCLTIKLLPEEEEPFLKSSLQFFDKTLKMLGFGAYDVESGPGPVTQIRLYDSVGRSFEGPRIEGKLWVRRSLFPNLEKMMLKWIELDRE